MLNGGFAAHLIEQHKFEAYNDYRRFPNGVIWRERMDATLSSTHMNSDRQVCRIADRPALETQPSTSAVWQDAPGADLEKSATKPAAAFC